MRTTIALCILALAFTTSACKKDDAKKEGGAAKTSDKAEPAAAKKGVKTLTAPEFFTHYMSLEGMAVLDEYGDGVIVSGTVKQTIEEGDGSFVVWLDANDGKWVSLGFVDKGAAAKAKGTKAGDALTAKCQVGGGMDNYIMNIDCELQK
jgi:hypothetical protein